MSATAALSLLPEAEAARRLNVSPAKLAMLRRTGRGPMYVRIGPRLVRYDPAALEAWIHIHTKAAGSEPAAA